VSRESTSRKYPVEWEDDTPWELALWRQQQTFPAVLNLIEEVARARGRQQSMEEMVPSPQDIHVPFTVAEGRLSFGSFETSALRAVVLAHTVHRVMRELARENAARIIRMVDAAGENGTVRRKIIVRWDEQSQSTAAQIKSLQQALQSGSRFKLEAAWFGLTPRAHEYLSIGRQGMISRCHLRCPVTVGTRPPKFVQLSPPSGASASSRARQRAWSPTASARAGRCSSAGAGQTRRGVASSARRAARSSGFAGQPESHRAS
jgi:hypothetical protein